MLSVLRPELYATDSGATGGRQEFDRLEAEYDEAEMKLDNSE